MQLRSSLQVRQIDRYIYMQYIYIKKSFFVLDSRIKVAIYVPALQSIQYLLRDMTSKYTNC